MSESAKRELPTVSVYVSVFDRNKRPLLPVKTRKLELKWERCSEVETGDILRLLPKRITPLWNNLQPGQTKTEMSVGSNHYSFPLRKYRGKFDYDDVPSLPIVIEEEPPYPVQLPLDPDYIENEAAEPITKSDMINHFHGTTEALVLGDVESLRKIGAKPAQNTQAWHGETAATISQFLRIVSFINRSQWARERISLTNVADGKGVDQPLSTILPQLHSFAAVAPFLRQLFDRKAMDNLLVKACELYCYFCSDDGKRFWVEHELQSAKNLLEHEPWIPKIPGVKNERLFEAVLYGTKLMHAKPRDGADEDAKKLVEQFGARHVAFAAHTAFKHYFSHCAMIAFAVHLDFSYWVQEQKLSLIDDDLMAMFFGTAM